jgi:hypothetical protein
MMFLVSAHFDRMTRPDLPPPNYYFSHPAHRQLPFTKGKRKLLSAGGRLTQGTVMNEKVDLVEREVNEVSFVDLGDAAEETRQFSPKPWYTDSAYGLGERCC